MRRDTGHEVAGKSATLSHTRNGMENRVMRNIYLALLGSSLLFLTTTTRADELLADANTNFGPAHPAGDQPAAPAAPVAAPAQPAPVPVAPPAPQPKAVAPQPAPVAVKSPAPAANPEAAQAAQDEALRRQAAQVQARALIDEGSKLYYAGKFDQAVVKLEQAVKILPRAKATEIDYSRATHALSDSYMQLADKAYRANDSSKAVEFAKKSLQYDPSNRTAENLIVKIKQADANAKVVAARPPSPVDGPRPDTTPEFLAKKDQIRKFFREGKILLNSGQFDEAEKRFQQVLLIDPYNADAQELLRMVSVAREPSTLAGQAAARTRALWQVEDTWLPPIGGEVRLPDPSTGGKVLPGATTAIAGISQKLKDIEFPEIKFREASLADVVQYLSSESQKLDPKGEGVNIVLGPGVASGVDEAAPAPEGGAAPAPAGGNTRKITLALRKVPMIEALKYITSLANLKYRIESSAVLIVPLDAVDEKMITRFYPVTAGAFSKFVTTPAGGGGGGGNDGIRTGAGVGAVQEIGGGPSATVGTVDVAELFKGAGVPFPPTSSILYNERTSTIVIHNTPENIEAFERALPSFDVVPKQIEIETRFIDISQGDLNALGFNWGVGEYTSGDYAIAGGSPTGNGGLGDITGALRDASGLGGSAIAAAITAGSGAAGVGTLATIKGVLTNPQFSLVIKALSLAKSTDVLSAPKVTTINGVQAQIKVVQEFIYPSEYSEPQPGTPPTINAAGVAVGGTSGTPSIPSAFKTREVGVILNVTPTVGSDNYTINLALTPEVTEFLGFLDYSPTATASASGSGSNSVTATSTPFKIVQPLFSTRSVATSVVIWDGQTVVLGGLLKENINKIDDKIPFLGDLPIIGRFFRSTATSRTKNNLLIFVTARLIDPAGNPIHKDSGRVSR